MKADVVIVGGGVIGASIARELSRYSLLWEPVRVIPGLSMPAIMLILKP